MGEKGYTMDMMWLKIAGVVFGAVAVTALGIDAADTIQGSRSTLLGQLISSTEGVCPAGMIALQAPTTFSCADIYEASPNEKCSLSEVKNEFDTLKNIENSDCSSQSKKNVKPWVFITREQASLVCTRAGKRLPNNEEWQTFAVGTPDNSDDCNISGVSADPTGNNNSCISAVKSYDAVGNVWEWTNEDVFDGVYNGRNLPGEGYVNQVDKGGVATVTGTSSSKLFKEDYFWSKTKGSYAIMRGGFYGSREDAGVYATQAATLPTASGAAIGFRCVK